MHRNVTGCVFLKHRTFHRSWSCVLEEAMFQESDEFTVRVAEDLDEAIKLMEADYLKLQLTSQC